MASQLAPRPTDISPEEWRAVQEYRQQRRPGGPWLALELVLAVRSLLTLVILALLVMLAINFVSTTGQVGQRLSGAWQRTEHAFGSAGQAMADTFNPTHPPRYAISQDTEFASLSALHAGDSIGDSRDYTFTFSAVHRRDDATANPDFAQYATVDRAYKIPRETKILGVTVHTDRGQQEYVLDRGETFRVGTGLYKVNWVSAADRELALATYRNPDQFAGKLAFESD